MTEQTQCPYCFSSIDSRAARCPSCTSRVGHRKQLTRDAPGKVIAGVCAALGERFEVDASMVRIVFVVSTFLVGPISLWAYALLWVVTPATVGGTSPGNRFIDSISNIFSSTPRRSRNVSDIDHLQP